MQLLSFPLRLLLADDDMDDRFFFSKALMAVPVPTVLTTVNDGEKLMQYFSQQGNELPDVVFMDLNMPRKNGIECLAEMRQNDKLKLLPVIIISTSGRDKLLDELYEGGAHYFFLKPDFPQLAGCIHNVLKFLQADQGQPAREHFLVNPPR